MARPKHFDPLSIFVGNALRTVRKQLGLTLEDVALELNVSAASISYYEKGRSQLHLRQFIQLCAVLDVDPAYIITAVLRDGAHLIKITGQQEP